MEAKKCCVPGCCGKENLLEFPHPTTHLDKFKAWISFIDVNPSDYSDNYQKIYKEYKRKRICSIHFTPIVYKNREGNRVVLYTVPDHYGPAFWKHNKKMTLEKYNYLREIALKKKNYLDIQKKDEYKTLTGLSNNISTASPRILRKRNISYSRKIVPLVVDPLVNTETSESTILPDKGLSNKSTASPSILRKRNLLVTRKIPSEKIELFEQDPLVNTEAPESATLPEEDSWRMSPGFTRTTQAQRVALNRRVPIPPASTSLQRSTRNNPLPALTDIKKPRIVDDKEADKTAGNNTDSEEFEVEYLDSEPDISDCDENTLQEIEYLDMDNLDLEDNLQPTNINTDITIKCASVINKTFSDLEDNQQSTNINTDNTIKCDSEISKIYSDLEDNQQSTNINKNITMKCASKINQIYSDVIEEVTIPYTEETSKTNTDNSPVITELNGTMGAPKTYSRKSKNNLATKVASVKTVSTKTPTATDQNNVVATENIDVGMEGKAITEAKPIFEPLDDTLQEFMRKHSLKPIDTNTLLNKKFCATVTQLEKQHNVKLPIEIAKQLPVSSSQNPTEINKPKETNVYVFDNKGTILIKEQLTGKAAPQVEKPAVTGSNGTKSLHIQQGPTPQGSGNTTCKPIPTTLQNERALRQELKNAKKLLYRYKSKDTRLKLKLKQAKVIFTNPNFLKATEQLPRIVRMITTIQLRESLKESQGRRFKDDEKELAVSLHEQCPNAYKYMLKMGFILPNPKSFRTLFKDSNQTNAESTINSNEAIAKLKAKVDKMPPEHRLCTLLFDEKWISPSNRKEQVVTVFGNEGEESKMTFEADHALVFMVKGILKHYQEPVSFTFSFGPTNGTDLALQIKNVISDLQAIGYKVLATICDHAENNRQAIKILTDEARCDSVLTENHIDNVFKVNNEEIIPLYDPPHLLKGVRNNLISKDLTFEVGGETKTAMWQHLEMLLNENPEYNGQRLVAKLTESHVYPTKQGITKTKYASQVFSQTVATYMGYLAEKGILPPESSDTADLLLFFDQLFDSLNGYSKNTNKNSKPLLAAVMPQSAHHNKWAEAIQVLKTMRFVNKGNVVGVSEIDCWIWTLEGYIILLRKLFTEHKLKTVWMRSINQDVLERLFRREVNPIPVVRARNSAEGKKKVTKPNRFPGEVVTQKVIKAINRINKQVETE